MLIGLHAKPDRPETFEEVEALVDVHAAVEQHWNTDSILIMGDLNADCNYIREDELPTLGLRTDPGFTWLIGDEVIRQFPAPTVPTTGARDCVSL